MARKSLHIFLLFHFSLMITGMLSLSFQKLGEAGRWLDIYGRITGARGSFGFFSPNVGNQFIVKFEVEPKEGKTFETRLEDLVSKETSIRIGNMNRLFTTFFSKQLLRRSIASSLTTHVFEVHPNAKRVTFHASLFDFPSLQAYGHGARTVISPVYEATFERAP